MAWRRFECRCGNPRTHSADTLSIGSHSAQSAAAQASSRILFAKSFGPEMLGKSEKPEASAAD